MSHILYVAEDGNYGDAHNMLLVDASNFTPEDWDALNYVGDTDRQFEATEIGVSHDAEPIVWCWATKNEAAQILATLEAVIAYHSTTGAPGFAEELGDIRDVLNRSGITA